MNWEWYFPIGIKEYIFLILFGIAIGLYLNRVLKLSIRLHQPKRWIFIKLPLRFLYFLLLIIALLGPSFGQDRKYIEAVGKDIYIAIDLSNSMNSKDIVPSRLEKLKLEIKNLIQALPSDRIGLIIFASDAYLQCPLTYDQSALDLFVQTTQTRLLPRNGTNFHAALELALNRLEGEASYSQEYTSKILILASDGEDFGEGMSRLINDYKNRGIKIFTIGIGTRQGSPVLKRGNLLLDKNGHKILSQLDYQQLAVISRSTGGQYFEISQLKNEMPLLIRAVQEIEGQKIDVRTLDVSYNKYEYFLWIALILILIDFVFIVKVLKI